MEAKIDGTKNVLEALLLPKRVHAGALVIASSIRATRPSRLSGGQCSCRRVCMSPIGSCDARDALRCPVAGASRHGANAVSTKTVPTPAMASPDFGRIASASTSGLIERHLAYGSVLRQPSDHGTGPPSRAKRQVGYAFEETAHNKRRSDPNPRRPPRDH